jgi:hypothetical protein
VMLFIVLYLVLSSIGIFVVVFHHRLIDRIWVRRELMHGLHWISASLFIISSLLVPSYLLRFDVVIYLCCCFFRHVDVLVELINQTSVHGPVALIILPGIPNHSGCFHRFGFHCCVACLVLVHGLIPCKVIMFLYDIVFQRRHLCPSSWLVFGGFTWSVRVVYFC